jgi:hypothetical protein
LNEDARSLEDGEGRTLLDQVESLVVVPGANTVATAIEILRGGEPIWAPEVNEAQAVVQAAAVVPRDPLERRERDVLEPLPWPATVDLVTAFRLRFPTGLTTF